MKLKHLLLAILLMLFGDCSVSINPMTIEVRQNDTLIENETGTYDFGSIEIGKESPVVSFTIHNLGYNDLELTGKPNKIQKFNDKYTSYVINQDDVNSFVSLVSPTSFSISFKPNTAGVLYATILIPNESDNFNPYKFTVTGIGVTYPEINVRQEALSIPINTGKYSFGSVRLGKSSKAVAFTIENLGSENLYLNGTSKIQISGSEASEFTVNQSTTTSPILPDNSTFFTVIFHPTKIGTKTAIITIANTDSDESSYIFMIYGRGKNFDFNGDGFDDLIVGADFAENDEVHAGCVYIFFGKSNFFQITGADLADVKLIGEDEFDFFGNNVSSAGDINGDGYDDVLIGAHAADDGGDDSGCAYIFFGSQNPSSNMYASNADVKIIGEDSGSIFGDKFGISVGCCGDYNGDGFEDIIIGASNNNEGGEQSGSAYIFFGNGNIPSEIDASEADIKFIGENENDFFGASVSNAGDINGDDYDDAIIGAPYGDDSGISCGKVYIFLGHPDPSSTIEASNADMKLLGENAYDCFGLSVSVAGDFNNDGFDDVLVGAYMVDDAGNNSGCVYIFFGEKNLKTAINASHANIIISGEVENGFFGNCVSWAGDINDDGFDDVIVGSRNSLDNFASIAYVFYGTASSQSKFFASEYGIKLTGCNPEANFGYCVNSAGDTNCDGFDDIIIGAPYDNDAGKGSGCSYVFFGGSNLASSIDDYHADVRLVGEDRGDNFGTSVAGGK